MKRIFLIASALVVSILMVSTVTAVPQSQSEPLMNNLSTLNQQKISLNDIFEEGSSIGTLDGLFDLIMQIIQWIAQIVIKIINVINSLIQIVSLLTYLVNMIQILINFIQYLIDIITNLFNPDVHTIIT